MPSGQQAAMQDPRRLPIQPPQQAHLLFRNSLESSSEESWKL
jgi:hypothetical protein